jgi:hypothetical protein
MNNVIRLVARKGADAVPSAPDNRIAAALTSVLATREQLSQKVQEFSKEFDAIENAIDTIEDLETRTRLRQTIKLCREAMSKAVLELTQRIGALVGHLGA